MDLSLTMQYRQVHYERGVVYSDMGQYDQAVTNFTKAIDLDPDCTIAYYDRAVAYQQLKEYENAVADFKHYLEVVPNPKNKAQILADMEMMQTELDNPTPKRWVGLTKAEAKKRRQEENDDDDDDDDDE